jgi:hypothetical protein
MQDERKADLHSDDEAVEERVRQMMDPSLKDVPKKATKATKKTDDKPAEPITAPEIEGLTVPKEPLKIKIIDGSAQNDDEPELEKPAETPPEPPKEPETSAEVPEPEEPKKPTLEPLEEDEKTAEAVDDIVAHESDDLLKAEDEKLAEAFRPAEKKTFGQRIKHFFKAWWGNPKSRWATIIILILAAAVTAVVPSSRYFVLNTTGVRASVSVRVLDESTFQPLKNVEVSAHGVSALTDKDGQANLKKIKLGATELKIEKRAFAPITQNITIGWGSNPQHDTQLKPVGAQYAFAVTDYLSGKGVKKVEAIQGGASAVSDDKGKIRLTLDRPADEFEVTIKGDGYREETIKLNANTKDEYPLQLVPARKQVFVSKRSGKLDVYKIDIDGKNEEKILPGTGSERDDMTLIVHPSDEVAALVSARDAKRNKDGYLLSTLTLIDLKNNVATPVATSERVQLVDWIGNRIVYVQVAAGTSAANPKRHRLMSYDYKENDNKELAATNYFNDVLTAGGKLYYAPSSAYQNGVNVSLFKIDADGSNRQVILGKEVWNLFRTAYDHLAVSVPGEWYDYRVGDKLAVKLGGEPPALTSRVYVDSPARQQSLWVDNRDGKGVLIAYDIEKKTEKILRTQSGLKNPVRWLNESTIIYRINTEQETADYAMSLNGGEPKKIRDVTNIGGVDQWYYY